MQKSLSVAALIALIALAPACGKKEDPAKPEDRLCGGETGVGLRVKGRASPLDVCVADPDVDMGITTINLDEYYDLTARMVSGGDIFEIQLLFPKRPDFPVDLAPTGALAALDTDSAWIYYQEIPQSGEAIESELVTAGAFHLGFAASDVATATLTGISLTMVRKSDGQPAGTRLIEEGFLSVSVK